MAAQRLSILILFAPMYVLHSYLHIFCLYIYNSSCKNNNIIYLKSYILNIMKCFNFLTLCFLFLSLSILLNLATPALLFQVRPLSFTFLFVGLILSELFKCLCTFLFAFLRGERVRFARYFLSPDYKICQILS